MSVKPCEAAIIGDDIDTDVGGGEQAGLRGFRCEPASTGPLTPRHRPSSRIGSSTRSAICPRRRACNQSCDLK
ncbi:MAG TPA: HAD hydrolase-like protein [Methylococcaceae bacterium]|nr:HAD hydrolase-like protein [Methylococcaceae bacterium]